MAARAHLTATIANRSDQFFRWNYIEQGRVPAGKSHDHFLSQKKTKNSKIPFSMWNFFNGKLMVKNQLDIILEQSNLIISANIAQFSQTTPYFKSFVSSFFAYYNVLFPLHPVPFTKTLTKIQLLFWQALGYSESVTASVFLNFFSQTAWGIKKWTVPSCHKLFWACF